jgi:hypothetical protein
VPPSNVCRPASPCLALALHEHGPHSHGLLSHICKAHTRTTHNTNTHTTHIHIDIHIHIHTTHNTQQTAHNTQHTTHNTQHTTHNTQHTTHLHGEGHVGRGTIPPLATRWPQVLKEEPAPGPAAEGYVQAVRDGGADAHVAPEREQAKHLCTSYAPYSRARTLAAAVAMALLCMLLWVPGSGSVGVW